MEEDEQAGSGETLPQLTANEARVIGCLIEKQATTPEVYPLTLNAIVLACNQKSNRDPLMNLDPGEVGHTVRQLESRRLIKATDAARAQRYEHCFDAIYHVTPPQRALLAALLLRGAQTLNELFTRTERLHRFSDFDDLRYTLERLMAREPKKVVRIPRAGGQREDRYMHLLCGAVSFDNATFEPAAYSEAQSGEARPGSGSSTAALEARVAALEQRLAELETALGVAPKAS